jgi:hypothetical protein
MCAATDVGVAAEAGSSDSIVKPVSSISTRTPASGLVVHWPPPGRLYTCCALLLAIMALTIRLLGPRTNNRQLDAV